MGDSCKGKDSFEWIKNRIFRRWYWDNVLKNRGPTGVEFDINAHCNRRCSYCPNATKPKPEAHLDEDAYKRIIDELTRNNFRGEISPSFYGEPMLDKRLPGFVEYARKRLPKSTIIVNTNGDLLTPENLKLLSQKGVDLFLISQHDPKPSKSIGRICEYVKDKPPLKCKVVVTNWTAPRRILSNRGGLIDDNRVNFMSGFGCFRSRRATITHDGSMIICCENFDADYIYGNVIRDGFMKVWQDSLNHRREIFSGNFIEPICQICTGIKRG